MDGYRRGEEVAKSRSRHRYILRLGLAVTAIRAAHRLTVAQDIEGPSAEGTRMAGRPADKIAGQITQSARSRTERW